MATRAIRPREKAHHGGRLCVDVRDQQSNNGTRVQLYACAIDQGNQSAGLGKGPAILSRLRQGRPLADLSPEKNFNTIASQLVPVVHIAMGGNWPGSASQSLGEQKVMCTGCRRRISL